MMSSVTESGESDVDVAQFFDWFGRADVKRRETLPSPLRSTLPVPVRMKPATNMPSSGWPEFKLDHLTQKFQDMCVNPLRSEPNDLSNAVVIPYSRRYRHARAPASGIEVSAEKIFNWSLTSEDCFHLTQPGHSGFRMFLRLATGLHSRIRSMSEMDGRSSCSSCRYRCPVHSRSSGRPTPYANSGKNLKIFQKMVTNSPSRMNLFHPDAKIIEVDEESETPVVQRKPGMTLEQILRDGAELPVLGGNVLPDRVQQSRDIEKVMRGLKYLAVS